MLENNTQSQQQPPQLPQQKELTEEEKQKALQLLARFKVNVGDGK